MQRDPLVYQMNWNGTGSTRPARTFRDGMSLPQYLSQRPLSWTDPTGRSGQCDSDCYEEYLDDLDWCLQDNSANYSNCVQNAEVWLAGCATSSVNASGCGNRPPSAAAGNCCYPSDHTYSWIYSNCMCRCMGDDAWSKRVRACLACYYNNGCDDDQSHGVCYAVGDSVATRPSGKLAACGIRCFFSQ